MKHASREWNNELCNQLLSQGFHQSSNDQCLFTRGSGVDFICLLVYVDDVLVTRPSQQNIDGLKAFLHKAFTIKDLGEVKYFTRMRIARSANGASLNQRKHVLDIFIQYWSYGPIPLPSGITLKQGTKLILDNSKLYMHLVGCTVAILNLTWPDLSYVT